MKIPFSLFFFLLAAALPSACLSAEPPDLSQLINLKQADRMVMVGFPDQSIARIEVGAGPATYRRRGAYSSSTWSRRITDQIAEDYHLIKIAEWPMTEVSVHCVVYQVPAGQTVPDTLKDLAKDARLAIVQPMHLFRTQATGQTDDPYFKLQSNLHRMQIDQAHRIATGKSVTIAMIDTGVDLKHPDLIGQIIKEHNFAAEVSSSFTDDKHGTAVAGVIAAKKDNGVGITGVAPDAKLIVYKACWPHQEDAIDAVCNSFTLALALNKAIKSGAQILNMSLSGPQDPLLELLLNKAIDNGMIIIAAHSKQPSGSKNFPASLHDVISAQTLADIDGGARYTDDAVSAPGEKILTTLPHGTYDFISGSSLSAAEVSGIVALLMEIKPNLKVREIKPILEKSQIITANKASRGVNANSAVSELCKVIACSEPTLGLAANKKQL